MKIVLLILCFLLNSVIQFQPEGCYSARNKDILEDYTLYNTSGNWQLDQIILQELAFMQQAFLLSPTFFLYDDSDEPNALATKDVTSSSGPDGTVLLGVTMLNRELIRTIGGVSIALIIAHEFGHLVDLKYGGLSIVSQKKRELFADFLAGSYMYVKQAYGATIDIDGCREAFVDLGDYEFGDVDHHGTPEEREVALMQGYMVAMQSIQSKGKYTLSDAIRAGRNYVKDIPDPENEDEEPD